MAVAGREVQYGERGDVKVGRVVDTVVDPNTGLAAQRERTFMAVPTGDGGAAVVFGERFRAVQMPNWIRHDIERQARPPALTSSMTVGRGTNGSNYDTLDSNDDEFSCYALLQLCCLSCFLPCTFNKICTAIWQAMVLAAIITLAIYTVIGPLHCKPLVGVSALSYVILGVLGLLSLTCMSFAYSRSKDMEILATCSACCGCILGVIFVVLVIILTGIVFGSSSVFDAVNNGEYHNTYNETVFCDYPTTPIGVVATMYAFMLLISCGWCFFCCCCLILKLGSN